MSALAKKRHQAAKEKAARNARLKIRACLLEKDSSLRQFALKHGYEPRTVTQVLTRWVGAEHLPQGRIAFCILRDLSKTVGYEVLPGILGEDFKAFAGAQQDKVA